MASKFIHQDQTAKTGGKDHVPADTRMAGLISPHRALTLEDEGLPKVLRNGGDQRRPSQKIRSILPSIRKHLDLQAESLRLPRGFAED